MLWIGRDDLQVPSLSQREQRVARSAARMDAAERGANAQVALDEFDALVQIAAAEEHVIEGSGNGRRAGAASAKSERTGERQDGST